MKIIEILETQLDKEIKSAEQNLNTGNLDAIYKLTAAIHCLKKRERHEREDVAIIEKYSNGKYDHNIDALHDAYMEAKKKYREMSDQGHKDKVMDCLCRLMTEVYDLVSCSLAECDFMEEKKVIERNIKMLADA